MARRTLIHLNEACVSKMAGRPTVQRFSSAASTSLSPWAFVKHVLNDADKATTVDIEGFDSPRVYDFVVLDPNTSNLIGVEVKTTLGDTIFLNPVQVGKDVALMLEGGATVRTSGEPIAGVSYARRAPRTN